MKSPLPTFASAALVLTLASGCALPPDRSAEGVLRHYADPEFGGLITLAGGKYKHEFEGSRSDDTSAGFVSLQAEGSWRPRVGAGVAIEAMKSNASLVGLAGAASQATSLEISPYIFYRFFAGDKFRMPLRFGPWFHMLSLDERDSTDSLDWESFGLRFALEPEIVIDRTQEFEWSLFGAISVAGSLTQVDSDSAAGDGNFETHGTGFGLELGPRLRWACYQASLSYIHRGLWMDETDPEAGLSIESIEASFNGVALSFGGSL